MSDYINIRNNCSLTPIIVTPIIYKPPLKLYGYDLLPMIKLEDDILRGEACLYLEHLKF